MRINNIYRACEGEGVHIGAPQVFIRTQGCSLHCKNCDTLSSWNPSHGTEMTTEEIIGKVNEFGLNRVSITGGNPLEAEGMFDLVKCLRQKGYYINIEVTGQDYDEDVFNHVHFISCDIKTPDTGVKASVDNLIHMLISFPYKMQLKAVCASIVDLDFIISHYNILRKHLGHSPFIITPCYTEKAVGFDFDMIDKIYNRIMDEKLDIRLIMQQHKIVYGSKREDV